MPDSAGIRRASLSTEAVLTRQLALVRYVTELEDGGQRAILRGAVEGDSAYTLTLESGTTRWIGTTRARPQLLPLPALPLRVSYGRGLALGRHFLVPVVDPAVGRQELLQVNVVAESTLAVPDSAVYDSASASWLAAHIEVLPAWRLTWADRGVAWKAWVDGRGSVVQASTPFGVALQRSAFEIVNAEFRRRSATARAVPARAIPWRPISQDSVRVLIPGATAAGLGGPFQRASGDTVVLIRAREDAPGQPMAAAYQLPARADTLLPWLLSEPPFTADQPAVRSLARSLVGSERNPARAARALVYGMPGGSSGLPEDASGPEVAGLFVAVARTAGLPARMVGGLRFAQGRWYYHTWAEVLLGEWIPVDPALGQFPADAGHLRLVVGSPGRAIDLVPRFGRLRPQVIPEGRR